MWIPIRLFTLISTVIRIPDPPFYFDVDPDPASQNDAVHGDPNLDPDPQH